MANSVSFLHSMMDGNDSNSEYTKSAYGATSTSESLEEGANHPDAAARGTNDPSHVAKKRRKRRRTLMKRHQRTPAPIARNSNAGSPIALTRTIACGTRNTKDTVSNPSATSLKWLSSQTTCLRRNWAGMQKMRIRRANDGARGQRILRGKIIITDGSRLYGRTVINTK